MTVMPPSAPEPIRFEVLLALSWAVFRRNWIVALLPVIVLVAYLAGTAIYIGIVALWALGHGGVDKPVPNVGAFVVMTLGYALLIVVMALWSFVATYGMADAAWAKGTATFADGFAAFGTRSGAMVLGFIGLCGVAIAAVILALPTLFLSLLALPLFTMYVAPAVVSGGRGGFAAIAESFRLVYRFFGPSAIVLLVLVAIRYGIGFLAAFAIVPLEFAMIPAPGHAMPQLPPIGLLTFSAVMFVIALLAAEAYGGYYTIAVVGLYRSLAAQPGAGAGLPPGRSYGG